MRFPAKIVREVFASARKTYPQRSEGRMLPEKGVRGTGAVALVPAAALEIPGARPALRIGSFPNDVPIGSTGLINASALGRIDVGRCETSKISFPIAIDRWVSILAAKGRLQVQKADSGRVSNIFTGRRT